MVRIFHWFPCFNQLVCPMKMPAGVGGSDNEMSWKKELGDGDQRGKRDCSRISATELEMGLGEKDIEAVGGIFPFYTFNIIYNIKMIG